MKTVVYTVLTGGYDKQLQQHLVREGYDYICFSNDIKEKRVGIWEIRKIPEVTDDSQRLSRYPKMNPHLFLQDYDYSIYVDANVKIQSDNVYERVGKLISEHVLMAGMKHLTCDCAYEEGLRVIRSRKDNNFSRVFKQLRYMRKQGFPYNYGMYEANFILRNHHHPRIIAMGEEWWRMFINYSKRDQLSFSYSIWKNNIPFVYIYPPGLNTRNCDDFLIIQHSKPIQHSRLKFMYPYLLKLLKFLISL